MYRRDPPQFEFGTYGEGFELARFIPDRPFECDAGRDDRVRAVVVLQHAAAVEG